MALTNHLRARAAQTGPPRHKGPHSFGENRYYCKLCPDVELKNRVSLGCHLTIYHGLPPVGVDTGKGDGFRCQTCSQIFDSKYFYNLHRQDCDLTSPYVGMINDDELATSKLQTPKGETCDQCGRTGFSTSTAVSIHQKYQCVKRNMSKNPSQTNLRRFQPNQSSANRVQLLRPQKTTISDPIPKEKPIPMAEMARLNDKAKSDPSVTMCDSCGRGPYNSYYYFMEHKKKYCARVHHYQRIKQHLILHLQNVQIMKKKNLIEVKKKNLDLRNIVSTSDEEDEDQSGSLLHCPYCNSEYLSREELAQHIKNTCPYRYQCPFCSNTYSAKDSYLQHKEICSKTAAIDKLALKAPKYKCRNCGLEFKVKQQLQCHEHACTKVYSADY